MKNTIKLFLVSLLIVMSILSCSSKKNENVNSLVIYTPATRFFIDRLVE